MVAKGMVKKMARASPSSPQRASTTGQPMNALLENVTQNCHIPFRPSGTRKSRESGMVNTM